VKAESTLEEQVNAITGSGITDLVQVTENLFDYSRVRSHFIFYEQIRSLFNFKLSYLLLA
jgi:hypothetical protein